MSYNKKYHKNQPKFYGYYPQEVKIDDVPGLLFVNEDEIMSKTDFYEMVELAKRFYESDEVEAWIEKENKINYWEGIGTELVEGKYLLPEPRVDRRIFRTNLKRNWGFTCQWCNRKVSSKNDVEYFWINERIKKQRDISGQCCSKACADNLWYDLIIEWVLDEKLMDIFHTDKNLKRNFI